MDSERKHDRVIPAMRVAGVVGSLALIGWGLTSPLFRDAEGFLAASFCLVLATGSALSLVSLSVGRTWRGSALWVALAIVGQATALQLTQAGPEVRNQHYLPYTEWLNGTHLGLALILLVQTGLVVWGLTKLWPTLRTWSRLDFRRWQMALVLLLFVLTSATLSRRVDVLVGELVLASLVQAVNLVNIILAALSLPLETRRHLATKLDQLLDGPHAGNEFRLVDRFSLVTALWVFAVALALVVLSYQRHPHVTDEVAYLYQARYFSNGLLFLPAPPVPAGFYVFATALEAGKWFSTFPPGWPAVLAVGVLLGVPWLVNPVLGAIGILLFYALIGTLFGRRIARLSTLLLALSPWYIFMAMSLMSHTLVLVLALSGALALVTAQRSGKLRWVPLAGLATGAVLLTRPLDGIVVAVVFGIWALFIRGRRWRFAPLLALGFTAALVSSLWFPYNRELTGDALTLPLTLGTDGFPPDAISLGFGPEKGLGWTGLDPFPGHDVKDALINADFNSYAVNVELFGWSTGSLVVLVLFLISGRMRKLDWLAAGFAVLVIFAYSFFWFSGGPDFGARYWYLIIVPGVVLTVRGLKWLDSLLSKGAGERLDRIPQLTAIALAALALINFFPWRAIDKYHHYLGMRPDIKTILSEHDLQDALVLVRGDRHPDFASAVVFNPLDLSARQPIFAWDRNLEVRRQLLNVYRDRSVWILNGPTITGRGYQLERYPPGDPEPLTEKQETR